MAKKRERKRSVSSSSGSSSSGSSSSGSSSDSSTTSGSGSDSEREQRKKKNSSSSTIKKSSERHEKIDSSKRQKKEGSDSSGKEQEDKHDAKKLSPDHSPHRDNNDDAPTPPPQVARDADTPPPPNQQKDMKSDATKEDKEPKPISKFAAAEAMKKASGRTGGIYVPPFKLAALQKEMSKMDKSSKEYQKLKWEQLRKSVNGFINKINIANIKEMIPELFEINLVRGRGLLARAIMKAQLASPGFTHIYAALVAVLNTKLPENGDLIVKRVIVGFRRAYKRRDKVLATAFAKFIAHLVNHQVLHELAALQLLTILLDEPTDDR